MAFLENSGEILSKFMIKFRRKYWSNLETTNFAHFLEKLQSNYEKYFEKIIGKFLKQNGRNLKKSFKEIKRKNCDQFSKGTK